MHISLFGKKVRRSTIWVAGLVAAGLVGVGTTTVLVVRSGEPELDIEELTEVVQAQSVTVRINANGVITPVRNVNISPKEPGRVMDLRVEQGDRVKRGDIIAVMENADVIAQGRQAEANAAEAEAGLQRLQASTPLDVDVARARLAEARVRSIEAQETRPERIAEAQASLRQAQIRAIENTESRDDELLEAQSRVEAAAARLLLAESKLQRNQILVEEGAIANDSFDEFVEQVRSAQASLEEARRRLDTLTITLESEELQAKAAVQEAQRRLETIRIETEAEMVRSQVAIQEAEDELSKIQGQPRQLEIRQSEAGLAEAAARLQELQVRFNDTAVRAPFNGIITQRYANVGAFVAPTTSASATASATSSSIVALASLEQEVLAEVPEVDIGQIQPEQEVAVVADAFPNQVFRGLVRLIAPEAVEQENVTLFQVRVALEPAAQKVLRSGMNVDLTFIGDRLRNALLVPSVAIVTREGETGVLIPNEEERPEFRPVIIGSAFGDRIQILDGVEAGERVFVELPEKMQLEDILDPESDEEGKENNTRDDNQTPE